MDFSYYHFLSGVYGWLCEQQHGIIISMARQAWCITFSSLQTYGVRIDFGSWMGVAGDYESIA